jgi:hypothetical protein
MTPVARLGKKLRAEFIQRLRADSMAAAVKDGS